MKHLSTTQGREQFLTWLFRLSDTEHIQKINYKELRIMLNAIERDGVDLGSLLFDDEVSFLTISLSPC